MTNPLQSKILVIGTYGQVGGSFYKLLHTWPNVTFTDISPRSADVVTLDITDFKGLDHLIKSIHPKFIVNCVAYTAVDQAETNADIATMVNAEAVAALARSAREVDAILIHYSTDYVFDGQGTTPWQETDPPSPINAYGRSKLAGEQAILSHLEKGYVFRTQWVYDKTGKNFLNTMLRLGAERPDLAVVGDQIGSPTSSDVIATYTLKAIEKIESGSMPPGIYHLSCHGEISWFDFAQEIFRLARINGLKLAVQNLKKISTADYPTPAVRPKNSRLNVSKLEKALGERLPDWKDALLKVFI